MAGRFLVASISTIIFLTVLSACGGGSSGGDTAGAPALTAFQALQEISDDLQSSPDNLSARAKQLVLARDHVGIFELVRDNIVVYPPLANGFNFWSDSQIRWGTRATLRGAAGTPREKVELLADLYRQAGFTAEVRTGKISPAVNFQGLFSGVVSPPRFNATSDLARKLRWYNALNITSASLDNVFDPDPTGTILSALSSTLVGFFNPTVDALPFTWDVNTAMPIVRVNVGGTWSYANPLVPGAVFGQHYMTTMPTSLASAMSTAQPIRFLLEAANSDNPSIKYPLFDKTYTANQVAGRRLVLQFIPATYPAALEFVTMEQVDVVTPTLRIEGDGVDPAVRDALSVVGTSINRRGDTYAVDFSVNPSGNVLVNGAQLANGTGNPAAVATLTATTISSQFPDIRLKVKALDSLGNSVDALLGGNFTITEDGEAQSFVLQRNVSPPPKVLLVFDNSSSIPNAFRNYTDPVTSLPVRNLSSFGMSVINSLLAAYPTAQFRVASSETDGWLNYKGAWSSSNTVLQTELDSITTCVGLCSWVWTTSGEAAKSGATVVMFVTDGNAGDSITAMATAKSLLGNAPPFVMVGVGDMAAVSATLGVTAAATLQEIASATGGAFSPAADTAAALNAVTGFVNAANKVGYEMVYRAPRAGLVTRAVNVALNGTPLSAAGTYTVPVLAAQVAPKRISGLYLTVTVGTSRVRQTLGGLPYAATGPITDAVVANVSEALLGRITFAVEGAAPMHSAWIDEWLKQKLATKPLYDAVSANDPVAARNALLNGFDITPLELFLIMRRLPDQYKSGTRTYETAPRIVAFRETPRFGIGWEVNMDMFARNTWRTVAADDVTGWRANMDRTLYQSLHEGGMFNTSTYSALNRLPLQSHRASNVSLDIGLAWPADTQVRTRWMRMAANVEAPELSMILPVAYTPDAFWLVDRRNGTTAGMLPNITGGATEIRLQNNLNKTELALDLISRYGTLAGGSGAVLGTWVSLEKTKARLVTHATIMLATMNTTPIDWVGLARQVGCDMAKLGADRIPLVNTFLSLDGDADMLNKLFGGSGTMMSNAIDGC